MLHHSGERHLKSEISNLQVEKSVLESRISGLLSTRASEKVGNMNSVKIFIIQKCLYYLPREKATLC